METHLEHKCPEYLENSSIVHLTTLFILIILRSSRRCIFTLLFILTNKVFILIFVAELIVK